MPACGVCRACAGCGEVFCEVCEQLQDTLAIVHTWQTHLAAIRTLPALIEQTHA